MSDVMIRDGVHWVSRVWADEKIEQLQKRNAELDRIADLIHYPDCWCTTAYPTLFDAINEFWGLCHDCTRGKDSE